MRPLNFFGSEQGTPARALYTRQILVSKALMAGYALTQGEYIARQDADDLSLPGWLRVQVNLLDADRSLSFVSCWAEVMGPEAEPLLLHKRPSVAQVATKFFVTARCGPPGHGSAS